MQWLRSVRTILFLLLLPSMAEAQNMVPNGNFESYTVCPTDVAQMNRCTGWRQYHGGTSDYYNICALGSNVGIPDNFSGYQLPVNGNGYAGFYTYNGVVDYKEYIARTIDALTPGMLYEVSVSVNLANKSGYATNDIGVWFYKNGPSATTGGSDVLPVKPQVSYANYGAVTDTSNWVRLIATFTADSAYSNIVIGGFGASTSRFQIGSVPSSPYACYLIDSIVVRPTNLDYNLTDTSFCVGDTLTLPFSAYPGKYSPANVFSLELSNANGGFANPSVIATQTGSKGGVFKWIVPATLTPGSGYKIRIKTSDVPDSSYISHAITIGNIMPNKPYGWSNVPVCEGSSLQLSAVSPTSSVSYIWEGPDGFWYNGQIATRSSIRPSQAGRYIVSTWLYGCMNADTINVDVVPTAGILGIKSNVQMCTGDTLTLSATSLITNASFKWTGPNAFLSNSKDTVIPNVSLSAAGKYTLTGYYLGCTSTYNVTVSVSDPPENVTASCNTPICPGDTIKLVAYSSTTGVSYRWDGPNRYASNKSAAVILDASSLLNGNYIASISQGYCTVRDTVNVNVIPVEHAMLAISNSPVCEHDTLKLYAGTSVSGATGFAWLGPGNFISNAKNPVISESSLNASGRYILTGDFSGCISRDTINVVIKPKPAKPSGATNSPLCEGEKLLLNGTGVNGITYNWSGPEDFRYNFINASLTDVQVTQGGNYVLSANVDGCISSDTVAVVVKPKPYIPELYANTPLFTGDTLTLNIKQPQSGVNYQWDGPAGFKSAALNPAINDITKNNAGTYNITAEKDGCSSAGLLLVTIEDRKDTTYVNVFPNANNGNFTISGKTRREQQIRLDISAGNGQQVYTTLIQTNKKQFSEHVFLKDSISSGVYTLRVLVDGRIHAIRIVVLRD